MRQTVEGEAYRTVERVVVENRDEIDRRFPKILRRVSGYNLADLRRRRRAAALAASRLLVGSEGTLAVTTEAEVELVPRPRHRGAARAALRLAPGRARRLAACLEFGPSAVELMDSLLLDLARKQRSLQEHDGRRRGPSRKPCSWSSSGRRRRPRSVDGCPRLKDRLARGARPHGRRPGPRPGRCATRCGACAARPLPLLYGMPGDRKPVTFVEDCAVDPARLPEFAARFREMLQRHGTDGAFYGHASVGCLHIRPVLEPEGPGRRDAGCGGSPRR